MFNTDDDDDFPLKFHDALGEHALSDTVRSAMIWACIKKFIPDIDHDEEFEISDAAKALSKAIVFHGPYSNFDTAASVSQNRLGILVAPVHLWTEKSQFVWVVCLSN